MRLDTGRTTVIERVERSSFGAAGDRLLVHLSIARKLLHVLEVPGHSHKVLMFWWRSQNKRRETDLPRKNKLNNLSSKPGLISETSVSCE